MSAGNRKQDLIAVVIADHRELTAAFSEFEVDNATRTMLDHITTLLVTHMVGEEQFLYPVARRSLPNGEGVAADKLFEHAEAEHLLRRLEQLDWWSSELDRSAVNLFTDVQAHMDCEEREVLPAVQRMCDARQLADLGAKFLRAKRVAPIRPHPSAPDSPPANKILDPGAGLVDRVHQALTGTTNFYQHRT